MDRDASSLDAWLASIGGRIADEALDEARAEVKALLKERLLDAALDRLDGFDRKPRSSRRSASGDIDDTVRAIARSADEPDRAEPRFGEDEWGLWAYGVIPPGTPVEGSDGVQPGEPARTVALDGLDVVVSRVRLADFDAGSADPDVTALAERAVAHERVLSGLIESGVSALPLRFGTVFRNEDDLRRTLAEHRDVLLRAIDRLHDRAEFDVKVLCRSGELVRSV